MGLNTASALSITFEFVIANKGIMSDGFFGKHIEPFVSKINPFGLYLIEKTGAILDQVNPASKYRLAFLMMRVGDP
ncbi:hypothetical protein D3C85_1484390 [compost metagenome]